MSTAAPIVVMPSILSADFTALGAAIDEVVAAGATVIHCDVMDGQFVPPITFGAQIVGQLRERLPAHIDLDVHVMIETPERQVEEFAKAGASGFTFHAEATSHAHRVLQHTRELGLRAGLAVCPATPPTIFEHTAELVDLALCMTVNPGWGGQKLIASTVAKAAQIRQIMGPDAIVQVDGGVDLHTAPQVAAAGANWLVAGSAVFGASDPGAAYQAILAAAEQAAEAGAPA